MQWGPGTLRVSGTSENVSSIACTTCNVNGPYGSMVIDNATIGYIGVYSYYSSDYVCVKWRDSSFRILRAVVELLACVRVTVVQSIAPGWLDTSLVSQKSHTHATPRVR